MLLAILTTLLVTVVAVQGTTPVALPITGPTTHNPTSTGPTTHNQTSSGPTTSTVPPTKTTTTNVNQCAVDKDVLTRYIAAACLYYDGKLQAENAGLNDSYRQCKQEKDQLGRNLEESKTELQAANRKEHDLKQKNRDCEGEKVTLNDKISNNAIKCEEDKGVLRQDWQKEERKRIAAEGREQDCKTTNQQLDGQIMKKNQELAAARTECQTEKINLKTEITAKLTGELTSARELHIAEILKANNNLAAANKECEAAKNLLTNEITAEGSRHQGTKNNFIRTLTETNMKCEAEKKAKDEKLTTTEADFQRLSAEYSGITFKVESPPSINPINGESVGGSTVVGNKLYVCTTSNINIVKLDDNGKPTKDVPEEIPFRSNGLGDTSDIGSVGNVLYILVVKQDVHCIYKTDVSKLNKLEAKDCMRLGLKPSRMRVTPRGAIYIWKADDGLLRELQVNENKLTPVRSINVNKNYPNLLNMVELPNQDIVISFGRSANGQSTGLCRLILTTSSDGKTFDGTCSKLLQRDDINYPTSLALIPGTNTIVLADRGNDHVTTGNKQPNIMGISPNLKTPATPAAVIPGFFIDSVYATDRYVYVSAYSARNSGIRQNFIRAYKIIWEPTTWTALK